MKRRLDLLLIERGIAETSNKAQALILAGQVRVFQQDPSGKKREITEKQLKPGTQFFDNAEIEIKSLPRFVSRGGEKLQFALDHWKISVENRVCLDVGSSTGGFTDCLLQNGAKNVYAVDVGYGQMHRKLRGHPKVQLYEKTHILKWQSPWSIPANPVHVENGKWKMESPTFATIDVSFISLKKVLQRTADLLKISLDSKRHPIIFQTEILALIKPQFEAGPKFIRKGIVKDLNVRSRIVQEMVHFAKEIGLDVVGHQPCPILGVKGNQEEWIYCRNK